MRQSNSGRLHFEEGSMEREESGAYRFLLESDPRAG